MAVTISGTEGIVAPSLESVSRTVIAGNHEIREHDILTTEVVNYNQALTSDLSGFGATGDVTIERVSARWRGYEGQYWSAATISSNASIFASSPQTATDANPYNYGTHNKGPRSGRGGLLDGWGGASGAIMKINKPAGGSDAWNNGVYIYNRPSVTHMKAKYYRFRAFMYVDTGSLTFSMAYLDDQSYWSLPTAQEWHYVDVILSGSNIMAPRKLMNIRQHGSTEARQIFMAFPTLEAVYGPGDSSSNAAQFISITG